MRSRRPKAEKGLWTEIGVAWPHQDGKGFNVKFNLLPNGADIVIREPKAEQAPAEAE